MSERVEIVPKHPEVVSLLFGVFEGAVQGQSILNSLEDL